MSQFSEKPLPEYIKKREEKESLRWAGFDSSLDIFPHLNLDWKQVEKTFRESKKPIGDLGSSFSSLPVEGELRGIDIVSVDLMHEYNRDRYEFHLGNTFSRGAVKDLYISHPSVIVPGAMEPNERIERDHYEESVGKAVKEAQDKMIVADIARLPLKDRSLSITILHDTLPKHSPDLKTFLEKQLPEILRVTDQTAYIYPMSIYKTTLWKTWKHSTDPETYGEDIWKEASKMTPEEKAEERWVWQTAEEDEKPLEKSALKELHPLYKETESVSQISDAAERSGFEFKLEKGTEDVFTRHEQEDVKLGVFTRIKQ
ncbi:MAG: hypothetical protein A3J07_01455 [Candidatus Doudnabacteria bacterium RIFCSPLOWO2_02_FULL_49_13]|nr:MAG: hypothetical protein A3J07_01455 [Candidatus Doudnabacteria bacterium RIFCSPLOWO2_02_FULL_49_13]